MTVVCEQCEPAREFANAGALRFHAIAKHNADAGRCPICDKEFQRLTAHTKKMHGTALLDLDAGDVLPRGPGGAAGVEANPNGDGEERPPATDDYLSDDDRAPTTPRRRKLSDRMRGKLWGSSSSSDTSPPSSSSDLYTANEKKPRAKLLGKRATTAPIMSLAWGGMGAALERTAADVPVGRVLQFQAPAAGEILDRLIAKTWVDRVLQPLAQKTDDVEALGALLALPALVAMVERSPSAAVSLEPILRQVIAANILSMAPVVKQKKSDAKKLRDVIAELDPDLAASGADPVDTILAAIFAPPPTGPPPEQGSPDVDHAGAAAL